MLTATVVEMLDFSEIRGLRDIAELLDEKPMIRPALLELARWMADYYCCPVETAICSVLPVAVRDGKVSEKRRNTVRVAREVTEEEITALEKRAPRQAVEIEHHLQPAGVGSLRDELADPGDRALHVELRALQHQLVRLDLREVEDVVDDRQQVSRGSGDLLELVLLPTGFHLGAQQVG